MARCWRVGLDSYCTSCGATIEEFWPLGLGRVWGDACGYIITDATLHHAVCANITRPTGACQGKILFADPVPAPDPGVGKRLMWRGA